MFGEEENYFLHDRSPYFDFVAGLILFFSKNRLNNSEVIAFKRARWNFNNSFRGSAIWRETIRLFPKDISYGPYVLIIILFG